MSWLADLAGKAEDFLNKVDQTAAVALQKDELLTNKKRSLSYGNFAVITSVPPMPVTQSQALSSPKRQTRSSPERSTTPTFRSSSSGRSSVNSKTKNDDDKLFEFLNSPDVQEPAQQESNLSLKNSQELKQDENDSTTDFTTNQGRESINGDSNAVDAVSNSDEVLESNTEMENKLLRNEVSSLNQEMLQMLHRTKECEAQLHDTREKLSTFNMHTSENDKQTQELRNQVNDLQEALGAKDSQLAVLRIRFQEADDELRIKRDLVDKMQQEREGILRDQCNSSGLQSQALQSLRDRLDETESTLIKERNNSKMLQNDFSQRQIKIEEENQQMTASLLENQRLLLTEKEKLSELTNQLRSTKSSLDASCQEFTDYKQKAQKILQSKEKLIASLKITTANENGNQSEAGAIAASVELEEVRQEREMLREELIQANGTIEKLRNEILDLETQSQNDLAIAQEQQRNLEEQINAEIRFKDDILQENVHIKEEMQFMKEEICRQKTMYQSRIHDRDNELEKLRKQLTMKMMNNNQSELESRLHTLTESLIHKQTMLEALSTEKNSLILQLERMEQQVKDNQSYIRRGNSTAFNVPEDNQMKGRMPEFLVESPFDGQVARRVKRAYNSVDKFSVRLGIFLRRYPMARIFVIIYMGLLHFFVMVVLLTYSPEVHPAPAPAPAPP